jgi:DNA-binding NarL/FixJ family response regulator
MFREGLMHILNLDPAIEVIGQAETGPEAIDMALALDPDIILMDVNMPGMSGIEATREIRASSAPSARYRIIGLSFHDEEEIVNAMLEAGANAYVNKASAAQDLLSTIHSQYQAARSA